MGYSRDSFVIRAGRIGILEVDEVDFAVWGRRAEDLGHGTWF